MLSMLKGQYKNWYIFACKVSWLVYDINVPLCKELLYVFEKPLPHSWNTFGKSSIEFKIFAGNVEIETQFWSL